MAATKNVKVTACWDALKKLDEAFVLLIEANCYHEAAYILGTMKEIVETVDEDYMDEDDD